MSRCTSARDAIMPITTAAGARGSDFPLPSGLAWSIEADDAALPLLFGSIEGTVALGDHL